MHEDHQVEEELLPQLRSMTDLESFTNADFAEKCVVAMSSIKKWPILKIRIFQ